MYLGVAFTQTGFDFKMSPASIPLEDIRPGGPPKDGIPALLNPTFLSNSEAHYLADQDTVIGLDLNGEERAYPYLLLAQHEVINDEINGQAIAVTYSPLCGSSSVFERTQNKKTLEYGVSGLLLYGCHLIFDRQTNSLWSPVKLEGVTGPQAGRNLQLIPATTMTWATWKSQHPNGKVLSIQTGHNLDYAENPYADYEKSNQLLFGISNPDPSFPAKSRVYGIKIKRATRTYPLSVLTSMNGSQPDFFQKKSLRLNYDPKTDVFEIKDEGGNLIPTVQSYWFAWKLYHPKTEVFKLPQ